jgi:putative transposase
MALNSNKGHAALRRGRFSQASTEYFLTLCTESRQAGLTTKCVANAILNEARAMSADGTWIMLCAVIMPDHLHLLINLGERLSLGKTVQRLKAKTSGTLRTRGIVWERGFFDRQMRPNDDRLAVFRYIYLNPYRAGLLASSDKWPHYYCCDEEWAWFRNMLDADRPIPEWLL